MNFGLDGRSAEIDFATTKKVLVEVNTNVAFTLCMQELHVKL